MTGHADGSGVLHLAGIYKQFGHIHALHSVDMTVSAAEVLAIVGDNGAGKSTLVKVIAGVIQADGGRMLVRGAPVRLRRPADARRLGIAVVFQDLAMVESLDIASNMFLGDLPRRGPFVNRRAMDAAAEQMLVSLGVDVRTPRTPLGLLPAGHRQAVAVARAMRANFDVMVMDEPTASLGVGQKQVVIDTIRQLRAEAKAVVLVSHDLEFVFGVADRIQVLRLGRTAAVLDVSETDRNEVVGLITGARA